MFFFFKLACIEEKKTIGIIQFFTSGDSSMKKTEIFR